MPALGFFVLLYIRVYVWPLYTHSDVSKQKKVKGRREKERKGKKGKDGTGIMPRLKHVGCTLDSDIVQIRRDDTPPTTGIVGRLRDNLRPLQDHILRALGVGAI